MTKEVAKKQKKRFVRYSEGAEMYSMGITKFQELCKDAKACYKHQLIKLVTCLGILT